MIYCIGYRPWAHNIYKGLMSKFPDKRFIVTNEVIQEELKSANPEFVLFYGWSDIIPKEIISSYVCLMLHPSPLPKYRGGTPLQNQIINGETDSAVTIFRMDEGIDTGPIYLQSYLSLDGDIDEILNRIEVLGLAMSIDILNGNYRVRVQDNDIATYFARRKGAALTLSDLETLTSRDVYNFARMLGGSNYPRPYIEMKDGSKLYLEKVSVDENI